ncbi:MAG: 30S ribosomal protein S8e [Candidatus Woesearchaeota archaeon]
MQVKMGISQLRSKRTKTGSRYKDSRKKKQSEIGSLPTLTKIGKQKVAEERSTGGNKSYKVLSADIANCFDPKTKKYSKVKIVAVKENPANRNYARRNIMTKGTIIETEKGDAKVTNRPGQDNVVNAVLV